MCLFLSGDWNFLTNILNYYLETFISHDIYCQEEDEPLPGMCLNWIFNFQYMKEWIFSNEAERDLWLCNEEVMKVFPSVSGKGPEEASKASSES